MNVGPGQIKAVKPARRREDGGYLYVIEFSTGVIKVGRTNDLDKRMNIHVKTAKLHLVSIARSWVSRRHLNFWENEGALIFYCREIYGEPIVGNEAFANADFDDIKDMAESLPFDVILDPAGRVEELWQAAKVIISRVNDMGKEACHEALFEIFTKIANLTPAPWNESEPDRAFQYLLAMSAEPTNLSARAVDFECSLRALFFLFNMRWPATFEEMVTLVDWPIERSRLRTGDARNP